MTAQASLLTRFPEAQAVLVFWLGDALRLGWPSTSRSDLWFGGGAALDHQIEQSFGDLVRQAAQGGLVPWEDTAQDRLAVVLLLDQFTRNVFRGHAAAFSGDQRACALAIDSLSNGWDKQLPLAGQVFMAMPLMHAETLEAQEQAVAFFTALWSEADAQHREALLGHLEAAREHHDLITRFGRFPHRNSVLDRVSTPEERHYLETGRRFGQ